MGRKYSKVLTIILVVIIVAIIGLLGFLGYSFYKKNSTTNNASDYVDSLNRQTANLDKPSDSNGNPSVDTPSTQQGQNSSGDSSDGLGTTSNYNNDNNSGNSSSSSTRKTSTYQGFESLGGIEIPKTGVKYPILAKLSSKALETAVVAIYPRDVKLNTVGNVVIAGHNYRNGTFFSDNKKLTNGDKIIITDLDGNSVTYVIYNKYETTDTDTKSYNKDTNGKREITLSTCTDDAKLRIIIEAREE